MKQCRNASQFQKILNILLIEWIQNNSLLWLVKISKLNTCLGCEVVHDFNNETQKEANLFHFGVLKNIFLTLKFLLYFFMSYYLLIFPRDGLQILFLRWSKLTLFPLKSPEKTGFLMITGEIELNLLNVGRKILIRSLKWRGY